MKKMLGIMWAAPSAVWIVVVPLLALGLLVYRWKQQQKVVKMLAALQNTAILTGYSYSKSLGKILLSFLGFICLALAFMRPQWGKKEEVVMQEGRDLLIALDISRSMLATDNKPDRLGFAKEKMRKLLKVLPCERVGLILFSEKAFIHCPLTSDPHSFLMMLDAVDVESVSSGSTNIASAIDVALAAFERTPDRKNKLLLLVTDGEDFSQISALKEKISQAQLTIFALGVGTQTGAPIPLKDHQGVMTGHQKDSKGNIVISRLNEPFLKTLAESAGGSYALLEKDDGNTQKLCDMIQSFEKERYEDKKIPTFQERYYYFLAVAFVCFLLEWLL